MRERMEWRAKRILPTNLPPHSQPSFPEPLTISNLQKQEWIWVPCNAPKSRALYHNLLIIKGPTKEVLAVGWKTRPAPETDTGRKWTEHTKKKEALAYEPERARCRWDLLIKDGGGLLSRPYGQYHRRWRA